MKHKLVLAIFFAILILAPLYQLPMFAKNFNVFASPSWPSSWILIDSDKNENGASDDTRDVRYAYYTYNSDYLFLRLTCYALPGDEWPGGARYKWFIDLDGDMYFSGGNVYNSEFLLFVEDADLNGIGEIYLLYEANNDGSYSEYEPWPPANYADYKVIDPDIASFIIVGSYDIEMYIGWTSIGSPTSYKLFWATDQQNPNLDQGPSTDRVDEEQPLAVQNVAAVYQSAFPQTVKQGEHVSIEVVVENEGTLAETFNVTSYFNNSLIDVKLVTNLAAAHQTTLTFDWDTSGIPEGVFVITAWADSSAAITETDEIDNWCTYPAMVTVQPAPVHDVAAISQVPDRTSVVQGETVNINVTISNFGDFGETFNVTCFYDHIVIAYSTIASMAQQSSMSTIFVWNTTGVAPGLYYVRAMADSNRVIDEIDETNNNCTSLEVITVYSSSEMGHLIIDKAQSCVISGEDPPVVGQTTVYELTLIITNIGGSNLTNVRVNDTISNDVNFASAGIPSQGTIASLPPPKLVWNVGTLAPGNIANLTFRVSITPSYLDTIYLNHKEDLVGSGIDILGHTSSAVGISDVTVEPIIRDVAAISQIPSSNIVCQGETISIQVTVQNYGNLTESFDVAAYYNDTQIGVLRVYSLEHGGLTAISFSLDTTGISPGNYSIKAKADSSSEINESNEVNNICTQPSTVEIVIHDVAVIDQIPFPTSVIKGETVSVNVVVVNEGTKPETFNVSCYLNETFIEKKAIVNLQPGMTTTVTFLCNTTSMPNGLFFVNAYASIVLGETDTIDNACRSTISISISLPLYQVVFGQSGLDNTAGVVLTVNGSSKTYNDLPYKVLATAGTIFTYSYQNVTSTTIGKRFVLTSIAGPTSPFVVAGNTTIIGTYKTQYLLTVTTTPPALIPQPLINPLGQSSPPSSWWYDTSTIVVLTAQTVAGHQFTDWNFDGISQGNGTNPISIIMNAPHTAIANYVQKAQMLVAISPMNSTIPLGASVHFTSNVTGGTPSYSYQWYLDGYPVTNATMDTATFTPTSGGSYYVYLKVTDAYNVTAQSGTARIIVTLVPVGGYSYSRVKETSIASPAIYLTILALFCATLSLTRRKKK